MDSLSLVGTDSDRVLGHSQEFNYLVDTNPLRDIIRYKRTEPGYFAPRLEGIWARFPYLHNGSVPTLYDLLSPADVRPLKFSLKHSEEFDRFDQVKVGLTSVDVIGDGRDIYNTNRIGHSNEGHEFYIESSHAVKLAIIEYLKTL